ncbi:MAG: serine hydrolase [Planctomycetota bacterium]|nr:serine hydrolase [Planctomycetota bacterium]
MDPVALQALANTVQSYIDHEKAIGAELLVIKNRRTVLHQAFGMNDRENEKAMEIGAIYNIRSMTKPLTGAALQLLIDQGKVSLDDKVSKFIPGFDNDQSREITVYQVLTHRSGLPLTAFEGKGLDHFESLQKVVQFLGEDGPQFEIDSKFWYSDAGTDVVGGLVEVISGQTLDDFVAHNLLQPLGMSDSFYMCGDGIDRWDDVASLYMSTGRSWSKIWSPISEKPYYPFAWGSQTIYSTPLDYAKFLALWIDEGRVGEKTLFSSEAIDRMLTPTTRMASLGKDSKMPTMFDGLEVWYGQMSILYVEEDGSVDSTPQVIGHSGSDGTFAWAWPEQDLIILYFTQSRLGMSGMSLEGQIDRLLIHPDREDEVAENPEDFPPYLGTYVANFHQFHETEFTVLVQNGRLAVDVPGQMIFELKVPDEEGKRYFTFTDQVAVTFDHDDAGAITGMKMYQAGQVFDIPKGKAKVIEEKPLDMDFVNRVVGTYLTVDSNQEVKVFVNDGKLAIQPVNVPMPLDLFPPDEDGHWVIRIQATVSIRFNEDEDGNIVSLTALEPEGKERLCMRVIEDEPRESTPND